VGEIFTLAMQEAMSCGLPIITTDDPGYRRYDVDRERIVFTDPTSELLLRHILRVLADDSLRRAMSAYSRALARAWFDWDANVVTLLDIYDQIATKQRGDPTAISNTMSAPLS
jgi:glycosyltransferase involved in cell wall biosynthesis